MRHKLKAIVLRENVKGETSKLLTVLTDKMGVLTVNAKGVRKLSSPYLKSAQLFAFSDMLLYEKNGFYTLTEAALITDFYPLSKNVTSYSLACYLCDAASSFAMPGEDSSDILRLLLNSLYALEKEIANPNIIKAAFELRLCSECGFYPDIDGCIDCQSNLTECEFLFDYTDGVSFCKSCASKNNNNMVINPNIAKSVKHITESELSKFISFRIGEEDERLLSDLAEKFFLSHAERGFKTLSFYKHCKELL